MTKKVKVSRDISGLKSCAYYVVKVRFFEGNFEHKSIFYHHSEGRGQLWSPNYENRHEINFATFYEIEIIEEIKGINE